MYMYQQGYFTFVCCSHQEYIKVVHNKRAKPAVWFKYELTPITVLYQEKQKPLYGFLTTVRV